MNGELITQNIESTLDSRKQEMGQAGNLKIVVSIPAQIG